MKKTILTTTLALGLGVSGFTAGQTADASEQDVNKEQLAEMAQADSSELNNAPIHAGEYSYNFNINGVNYNFESDGTNYSWSYGGYDNEQEVQPQEDTAPQVTEENTEQTQQQATQNTQQSQQQADTAPQVTEENTEQSEDVQPAAPEQSSDQTQQQATQNTQQSADGSTKEQFLASGGTEAMWQNIVMPESSGDPNAVNELGYQGLGQTKESWGTGSVEEQTEGMINYGEERYGSMEAAMEFREANNWW